MTGVTYKLTYFNVRARGEPIRLLFALADVPYEDVRINKSDWSPEVKNSFPWAQLPILEVNGTIVGQSNAILRYLAKQFNLTGANDLEAARCDELVDSMMDLRAEWKLFYKDENQVTKKIMRDRLTQNSIPKYLGKFDKILGDSDGDFFLGKNVSWADIHIVNTLDLYKDTIDVNILDNYPNLQKLQESVYSIPNIKAWIEKRPKSDH